MEDRLLVAVARDGSLRARAATTTGVVAEALVRHAPGTLAALALGRALSAAAVYPASEKDSDRVLIQWSGRGPLGTVMAELRPPGRLRGLVTGRGALPRDGYQGWRGVGYGLLPGGFVSVVRQEPSAAFAQSKIELTNGEIDEDLETYFQKSEQTPTRVRALVDIPPEGLSVRSAAVLVQALPGADESQLPDRNVHARLSPQMPPEELLAAVLGGRPFDVLEEHPLRFECPCSEGRLRAALGLLSSDELRSMMEEDGGARVSCDFCSTHYVFTRDDLAQVLADKSAGA